MPDQAGGLPSRPSLVNDIKFSADGSRMAAAFIEHNRGSNDWVASTVLVWDTADLSRPVNRIRLDAAGLVKLPSARTGVGSWVYRERDGRARLTDYLLRHGDRETYTMFHADARMVALPGQGRRTSARPLRGRERCADGHPDRQGEETGRGRGVD